MTWVRNDDRSWDGPPKKEGKPPRHVEQEFNDELEDLLFDVYNRLLARETVMILFEDMFEINERFQAVTDWFKARGIGMKHRYQSGCIMETDGWLYFCPADVHIVKTRGVNLELDLQPYAHELVRKSGLEARLRRKAAST